jgi:hypothetical protein
VVSSVNYGRKIGVFEVATVLYEYVLDVRFSVSDEQFAVLAPSVPGQPVVPASFETFEVFRGPALASVKREVEAFLRKRDTTTFSDVIEYRFGGEECARIDFNFRVARVSEVRGRNGRPRLEVPVDVSVEGVVVVRISVHDHSPYSARNYTGYGMDESVPFTIERYRKCVLIRDGVERLRELLGEIFGVGAEVASRLDAASGGMVTSGGLAALLMGGP